MEGRGGHYRHDTLPSHALHWHILDAQLCERLSWLRDLRVKADYHRDFVDSDEAAQAAEAARAIVNTLNKEVSHESA
jgi:hypothetical protein